jgi:hypothetical protein
MEKRHMPEFPTEGIHQRQQRHLELGLIQVGHQRQGALTRILYQAD